jgi:hypothetical protein
VASNLVTFLGVGCLCLSSYFYNQELRKKIAYQYKTILLTFENDIREYMNIQTGVFRVYNMIKVIDSFYKEPLEGRSDLSFSPEDNSHSDFSYINLDWPATLFNMGAASLTVGVLGLAGNYFTAENSASINQQPVADEEF